MNTETKVKVTDAQKSFWKGVVKMTGGLTLWEKVGKSAEAVIRVGLSSVQKKRIFEVYDPINKDWSFAHTSKSVYGTEEDYEVNDEVSANIAKFSAIDRPRSVVIAHCANHEHGESMLKNWEIGRTLIDGQLPTRVVIATVE